MVDGTIGSKHDDIVTLTIGLGDFFGGRMERFGVCGNL